MISSCTVMEPDYGTSPQKLEHPSKSFAGHSIPSACVLAKESVHPWERERGRVRRHQVSRRQYSVLTPLPRFCHPLPQIPNSVLVGPAPFIRKARHFRKLFGAGIRQSGCLAAAARTGLLENFPKLRGTHELARFVADELEKLGVAIVGRPETCMVSSWAFVLIKHKHQEAAVDERASHLTALC